MNYAKYTDDELRRELAVQPYNVVARVEAAERFCKAATGKAIEDAYEKGYKAGKEDGYRKGTDD